MPIKPGTVLIFVALILLIVVVGVLTIKEKGAVILQQITPTIDIPLSVTQTLIAMSTVTPTFTIQVEPTIPAKPSPTSDPTQVSIPKEFYIRDIIGTGQYFALGCEASAAVDLAGYYDILIYEYTFQHELPLSDNPDLGFVGDAKGPWGQVPPYAYGVYAEPVAALLRQYGLDVEGGKGYTLEQIKEKLAQSHPVIVWVIGNMVGGVPAEYTDSKGNKTIVAAYEHVVILTGYSEDHIRYLNNGRFFEAPNEVFLNSWGVLGNMAVFHK
jgi:uncharacterized protein YvpB